ncbi:DeoR/GlpR transcriptional regulator [Curtobacterium sp. MCPF17_011]|nr:DeoR/GlpR transcriptional regulator [Curtobacterium sp. MCPF17_011]
MSRRSPSKVSEHSPACLPTRCSAVKSFERHQLILDQASSGEPVTIDALIDATGASPSTVRRDIKALEESGRIVSLRGGAIRLEDAATEVPVAAKSLINPDEKRSIAEAAAALISDGDTIYLDSGTTATEVMRALHGITVHVITSNTHALALPIAPTVTVTVLGGDLLPDIGSVAGPITDRELNDLYFDKAFIGVTGIDADAGVTTFDIREATKKRVVHAHSRHTYVLADSSKFDHISLCHAFPLADCTVITDKQGDVLSAAGAAVIAT